MIVTTLRVYRAGAIVPGLTAIQATIFTDTLNMQSLDGGAADYDSYSIFCPWANVAIRRGDTLQDETTGTDNYVVVNKPEQFPNGGCKIKAIQKVGT